MTSTETPRTRGRPPAASREDVLAAAMYRYLRGQRVDVRAIAAELGLGRTTIYRWFGSREGLIGEVLVRAAEPLLDEARAEAERNGRRTPARHLRPLQPQPRGGSGPAPLRRAGARGGAAHHHLGRGHRAAAASSPTSEVIEDEVRAGSYEPPVEPATLGYAIVRLAEAFLFNEAAAGMRGDVDRLRDVEAALLGVTK